MTVTTEMLDAMLASGLTAEQIVSITKTAIAADEARRADLKAYGGWLGLRLAVFDRDGSQCTYCGAVGDVSGLHCDHVIPRCKGGTDTLDNLTTSCPRCNLSKGPRETPKGARL